VGLFTQHLQGKIQVAASAAGALRWRSCAMCVENPANGLSLEAVGAGVRVQGSGLNREVYISGAYQIQAAGLPAIKLHFPLHIQASESHLLFTAAVPVEEYVAAVLVGESGEFKNDEAIKAMAVATRTYATRFHNKHGQEGFDFCDTTHCQVPRWNDVPQRFRAAAEATRGEVLLFEGAPAETYYHQNCGGTAAAGNEVWPTVSAPYLRTHPDPYCSANAPLQWESIILIADLNAALRDAHLGSPRGWSALEIATRLPSGRAQRLRLRGGDSPETMISASSFRYAVDRALGWNKIRSDLYEIRNIGGQIIFSGRGSGHGVGLCQAGAEEMARQGKDYRQILSFYFPGTELSKTTEEKWRTQTTEHFELLTAAQEEEASLLPITESILKQDEESVGWTLSFRVRLQVFSTLDRYRDVTGQPGWVAASTRGHTIRLQPLDVLRKKSILESTLRHELFHLLIESRARAGLPLWFREGLALYLSNPLNNTLVTALITDDQLEAMFQNPTDREQLRTAYSAAHARVASLMEQYGKKTVLGWLDGDIPRSVLRTAAPASNHGARQEPGKKPK